MVEELTEKQYRNYSRTFFFITLLSFIIALLLLFHIVHGATNTTTTSELHAINIPLFGQITVAGGIVAFVMFILGWIMGQSLKMGIKIIFIILIFLFVLYVLGFLSHDILSKILLGVKELSGLGESLQNNFGMGSGALNLQLAAFVAGLVLGLVKG